MQLLVFRVFLFVKKVVETLYGAGSTAVTVVNRAIQANEYVFYDGYSTAFPSYTVKRLGPGIPAVSWTFDADKLIFYKDETNTEYQSLPWLTASIEYNGMNLYSMDDFVSEVRYSGSDAPSPSILIGGWILKTGNVLDQNLDIAIRVITEDGEEMLVSPWSTEPVDREVQTVFQITGIDYTPAPAPSPVDQAPVTGLPKEEEGTTYYEDVD
jgi:hypothetical protein